MFCSRFFQEAPKSFITVAYKNAEPGRIPSAFRGIYHWVMNFDVVFVVIVVIDFKDMNPSVFKLVSELSLLFKILSVLSVYLVDSNNRHHNGLQVHMLLGKVFFQIIQLTVICIFLHVVICYSKQYQTSSHLQKLKDSDLHLFYESE